MTEEMELYIHIPFCVKKCNYCDFLSGPADAATQHAYALALCQELRYLGRQWTKRPVKISSVFIGGGTPSWLDGTDMERILETAFSHFSVDHDAEVTIECNPGTVTREKLLLYKKYGVNRLSIGMQSADEEELRLLGRIHTFPQFLKTFQMARELRFSNINVDVMTGLPFQKWETLKKTLEKTVRLGPEHISAYGLIVEEGTPFYQVYASDVERREVGEATEALPDEEAELMLLQRTKEFLESHGYRQYEISNFAKKGKQCRHNAGYWKRTPYIGCGIGAASLLENRRCSNVTDIHEYIRRCGMLGDEAKWQQGQLPEITERAGQAVNMPGKEARYQYQSPLWDSCETLSQKDAMAEFMFLGLRMTEGIRTEEFAEAFSVSIEEIYGPVLEKLRREGLLVAEDGRVFLTERGRNVSNVALAEFLL